MARILLVDDDPQALESTRKILEFSGFEVITALDGQAALDCVRSSLGKSHVSFELVITDVRMPRLGGLEFLRALSLCGELIPVILMTAFGRVEDAVWAMKLGAVDFLTKPFKRQTLLTAVSAALERSKVKNLGFPLGSASASESLPSASGESHLLIGTSEVMSQLKDLIRRIASTHANILLTGESGTGKELVARCLHSQSIRANGKFIALNCTAVPDQLIESELFGYEKGAFTGATSSKEGLFEAAHGGTLLLDEIGDMPLALQSKFLRVLQEGEIRKLGSTQSKKVDVRVIAATHKNLKQGVEEGSFRQDLLYRLEVIELHIPPLRDRTTDIPELANHFLRVACRRHSKEVTKISDEAMHLLMSYPWPGNVRELSNVIERGVVFANGAELTTKELPSHIYELQKANKSFSNTSISVPLGTPLKDVEDLLIRKTLEATAGDKNMTALLLGINSRTIYRKLDRKVEKESEPEVLE